MNPKFRQMGIQYGTSHLRCVLSQHSKRVLHEMERKTVKAVSWGSGLHRKPSYLRFLVIVHYNSLNIVHHNRILIIFCYELLTV